MIALVRFIVFLLLIGSFYLVCYIIDEEPHKLAAMFALGYILTDLVFGLVKK